MYIYIYTHIYIYIEQSQLCLYMCVVTYIYIYITEYCIYNMYYLMMCAQIKTCVGDTYYHVYHIPHVSVGRDLMICLLYTRTIFHNKWFPMVYDIKKTWCTKPKHSTSGLEMPQ